VSSANFEPSDHPSLLTTAPLPSGSQTRFRSAKQQAIGESAICDAICVAKAKVCELRVPLPRAAGREAQSEEETELTGIERQRLANIKANLQRLNELGLGPGGYMCVGELVPLCMCIHKYK
jgi:hypothetical protein